MIDLPFEDVHIEFDGKQIFTRSWQPERGSSPGTSKPPIILFHDSLGCVDLWRGFPAALCSITNRPVIAYDRIGHGKSSPFSAPQPLDFIEKEAAVIFPALCRQLDIKRFIAFGHSVGGAIAVNCAAYFKDSCEALITESTQAFVEERTRTGILEEKRLFEHTSKFERLEKYHGEKTTWVFDSWINTWLSPAFSNWSLKDILPQVESPVLALHGLLDEYGSPAHPEMICSKVSGPASMKLLADCRHVPHREREKQVLGIIGDFLRNLCN